MKKKVLYQIALFQSVALGDYYGVTTAGEPKKHGDFGIGFFEGTDGELIMLDGVIHQAIHDGSVFVPGDEALIPYANAVFFESDFSIEGFEAGSYTDLEEKLTVITDKIGKNMIFCAKISGLFEKVSVRSELKQSEPYRMLNIILRDSQKRYDYKNLKGTIVALYMPSYMKALNSPGWHFHFISEDGKYGGHMLNVNVKDAVLEFMKVNGFELDIPDNKRFNDWDLSLDLSKVIEEAEAGDKDTDET